MTAQDQDRIDMLERGIGIAREYQRAKCAALRSYDEEATFEEELRPHFPRFHAACNDWYEWLSDFQFLFPPQSTALWTPQTDWHIREY
jgi:hypothetical protein